MNAHDDELSARLRRLADTGSAQPLPEAEMIRGRSDRRRRNRRVAATLSMVAVIAAGTAVGVSYAGGGSTRLQIRPPATSPTASFAPTATPRPKPVVRQTPPVIRPTNPASTLPGVVDDCRAGARDSSATHIRPAKIFLACADPTRWVQDLRWTQWTRTQAIGTGAVWEKNCTPSCAQGTWHHAAARIQLYRVVTSERGEVFARMHASYTSGTLSGKSSEDFNLPQPAHQVDSHIQVYGDCRNLAVEPVEIVLTCADYGWRLENITWTSWSTTQATAVVDQVYNDCAPSCARGHQHTINDTRITLYKIARAKDGSVVWSMIRLDRVPPGTTSKSWPMPLQPI